MRSKICEALKYNGTSSSTWNILGVDNDTYRKWIEYQMTPEKNWSKFEIDHVRPVSSYHVPNDKVLKEAFNWNNSYSTIFKKKFISINELSLISSHTVYNSSKHTNSLS